MTICLRCLGDYNDESGNKVINEISRRFNAGEEIGSFVCGRFITKPDTHGFGVQLLYGVIEAQSFHFKEYTSNVVPPKDRSLSSLKSLVSKFGFELA